MATPLLLWENMFHTTGAVLTSDGGQTAGWDRSKLKDWRTGTAFRWKSGSTGQTQSVFCDLGSGVTADPTAVCVAGHNLFTAGAPGSQIGVQYSDTGVGGPWTIALAGGGIAATDNLPWLRRFASVGAHRYWRFVLATTSASAFAVLPQIAIIAIGRYLSFGLPLEDGFDAYGYEWDTERNTSEKGAPIGVNRLGKLRVFKTKYDAQGLPVSTFFKPSEPSFDNGFVPHAIAAGKPFFFAWDADQDSSGVYLCNVDGYKISMPHVGTNARRGLEMQLNAWREVA